MVIQMIKNNILTFIGSYESKPNCAVRYGEWKAVVNDRRIGYNIELYNIKEDEKEEINVANKHPEVLRKIRN